MKRYTGVFDSNGNELIEGDIIIIDNNKSLTCKIVMEQGHYLAIKPRRNIKLQLGKLVKTQKVQLVKPIIFNGCMFDVEVIDRKNDKKSKAEELNFKLLKLSNSLEQFCDIQLKEIENFINGLEGE